MNKKFTTFVAAAVLATVPLAISTQEAAAIHKQWHKGLAQGIGAGIGFGIANKLLNPTPKQPSVVYVQPTPQPTYVQPAPQGFSQYHYNWCFSRYRSYHAASNTYQPYNGPRRQCYPY